MGDIKEVSDGYAQNYLLPRKLARPADKHAVLRAESLKSRREADRAKRNEWAQEIAQKTSEITITIEADANIEGHLYGSVDAKMIAHKATDAGIAITVDDISLEHPLKNTGEHEVTLDLTPDVTARLKVHIVAKEKTA